MQTSSNCENIILDTDMGPDCDDAGALGMLHALANKNRAKILAVTHCTSNPYGAGCIDAINHWYGQCDIPVGTLESMGFLDEDNYKQYNKYIAQNYINRYPDGQNVPSAVEVLRHTLAKQKDNTVIIAAIGPLINMANLLKSKPDNYSPLYGYELVDKKVRRLVVMGGGMKDAEWNFLMHPKAAKEVCEKWPSEIWFSMFELGEQILTGIKWGRTPNEHPVRKAYELHSPNGRMSWDLTAVWAAVMGAAPYFELSGLGTMSVNDDGTNTWSIDKKGKHRYLKIKAPKNVIENDFDVLLSESAEAGSKYV